MRQKSCKKCLIDDSRCVPPVGSGVTTDLLVAVTSENTTLATAGQTRVAAFNGTADFSGLTVRAATQPTAYTLSFRPSNASIAGVSAGAGTLDVTPASLNVVIQPCITGAVPGSYLVLCIVWRLLLMSFFICLDTAFILLQSVLVACR